MEGGSTITQQLAKNFYLSPERSLRRKISEAIMALMLEEKLSKKEILELYLNEIYLGQRGPIGIHGVGEASRFYFGKDVQHLSLPEGALLAGMIRAPNLYNPYRHPQEAKARRDTVLAAMRDLKMITRSECKQYAAVPLKLASPKIETNVAPYFADVTKAQLNEKYDNETLATNNLRIFTTLDLEMQEHAERILREGLDGIDGRSNRADGKKVQGSLIAIDPQTGYIRAFVGGGDYAKSQFNRISQASRQPGSVFKPVVYAAALERAFERSRQQKVFTTATVLKDEPWILQYADKTWEPKNYDGKYHGNVNLRTALTYSMNVATARLAAEVGFDEVAELGSRLGFHNVRAYPSIALGTFEASPWEVARAYAVFASGGLQRELQSIRR
ncbi:MAG TPA: transglycosylase domain-containing protein, partial [Acidobacteriota bacterium]